MRTFKKRYIVSEEIGRTFVVLIVKYLGTFNQRKIGRNRRGMVFLCGASGHQLDDGKFEITLEFSTGGRSMFARVVRGQRFPIYGFSDFRKLLRILAIACLSR